MKCLSSKITSDRQNECATVFSHSQHQNAKQVNQQVIACDGMHYAALWAKLRLQRSGSGIPRKLDGIHTGRDFGAGKKAKFAKPEGGLSTVTN